LAPGRRQEITITFHERERRVSFHELCGFWEVVSCAGQQRAVWGQQCGSGELGGLDGGRGRTRCPHPWSKGPSRRDDSRRSQQQRAFPGSLGRRSRFFPRFASNGQPAEESGILSF
jgi:hypothetical protein